MPFWNDGLLARSKKDSAVDIDKVFSINAYAGAGVGTTVTTGINITGIISTLAYGDPLQGGFYGGLIRDNFEVYALIVSPKSVEASMVFRTATGAVSTNSRSDGLGNTLIHAADPLCTAAIYCVGLTTGGYNDWYIGAIDEYQALYTNLKPTTTTTVTTSGINSNSVPVRLLNYVAADVTQTPNTAFRSTGTEFFSASSYRTSTTNGGSNTFYVSFTNGSTGNTAVNTSAPIRPIRRVNIKDPSVKHLFEDNTGLNWIKARTYATGMQYRKDAVLYDAYLNSVTTAIPVVDSLLTENPTGFTLANNVHVSNTSYTYVSWSFKKAKRFFDIVFYVGDGTSNRQIPHGLECDVGQVVIKNLTSVGNWSVWFKPAVTTTPPQYLVQNTNAVPVAGVAAIFPADPTDEYFSVGNNALVNTDGNMYAAYIYAHDDRSSGVVKTGVYTGTGVSGLTVDVGWEPQYLIIKDITTAGAWIVGDNKRTGVLIPNTTASEYLPGQLNFTPTGFRLDGTDTTMNTTSDNYAWMAIRKKSVPNDIRTMFSSQLYSNVTQPNVISMGYVDLFNYDGLIWTKGLNIIAGANNVLVDTITGLNKLNYTDASNKELTFSPLSITQPYKYTIITNDNNFNRSGGSNPYQSWTFRKAPKFFDILLYTGDGSGSKTVPHSLQSTPGLYMIKSRDNAGNWAVFHKDVSNGKFYSPAKTWTAGGAAFDADAANINASLNNSGENYLMYAFGHDPSPTGNIQCGYYTGNGNMSGPLINLGWEPQLVMIKQVEATSDWYMFDQANSANFSGNDGYTLVNTLDNLNKSFQVLAITPNTGFQITTTISIWNTNGAKYVYIAIRKPS